MKNQIITFKESYLIPKIFFDAMTKKLKFKEPRFSLEKLKSDLTVPADIRLKKRDFLKKYQSKQPVVHQADSGSCPEQAPIKKPDRGQSTAEDHFEFLIDPVLPVAKKDLARRLLNYSDNSAENILGWDKNYSIFFDRERLRGLNMKTALEVLVGEKLDSNRDYYVIYKYFVSIGTPAELLKFCPHFDESDFEEEIQKAWSPPSAGKPWGEFLPKSESTNKTIVDHSPSDWTPKKSRTPRTQLDWDHPTDTEDLFNTPTGESLSQSKKKKNRRKKRLSAEEKHSMSLRSGQTANWVKIKE